MHTHKRKPHEQKTTHTKENRINKNNTHTKENRINKKTHTHKKSASTKKNTFKQNK